MLRLPPNSRPVSAWVHTCAKFEAIAEVAQEAAISPETLRRIETGRMPTPAFTTIAASASALTVPLDDLAHICLARADLQESG